MTILQHCGGGAFGEVYYCQDLTGQLLALKICPKGVRNDKTWQRELKGLINYRKVSADLPGLLKIFHVEETEDSLYYTMEPADMVERDGVFRPDTLALRLQEGALPADVLMPVLENILLGIANLHSAGIAHRDIKPENILFVQGVPKPADMGLLSSISSLSSLAGTLDFIPPEIRSGSSSSSGESNQRNDLYAFGKLIYCCISGKTADEFPHVPYKVFDLPVVKYLFRLSLRLCERAPLRRLTSLTTLQQEFLRIRRIAEHGESLRDRLHYLNHALWLHLGYGMRVAGKTLKKHWLFFLSFCLVLCGVGWLLRPSSADDPSRQPTRLHQNTKIGYAAELPEDWLVMSSEEMYQTVLELEKEMDDEPEGTPEEEERMQLLMDLVKKNAGNLPNQETIILNIDSLGTQTESINVIRFDGLGDHFFTPSEQMLVFDFFGNLNDSGCNPKIHGKGCYSTTFNGLPCRVIEYSLIPGFIQNYLCIFRDGADAVTVELSCMPPNYLKRKGQVEAMLKTFRIIPRAAAP
ncbi:MAG: serine/threonine protein kinase [Oligosphaeraceae bacterium]